MTAALLTEGQETHQLSSGPMMRLLVMAGIAERADGGSAKRPSYRLTDAGKRMAALIGRRRAPPAREHLEAKISAYRARRMHSFRRTGPSNGRRPRRYQATCVNLDFRLTPKFECSRPGEGNRAIATREFALLLLEGAGAHELLPQGKGRGSVRWPLTFANGPNR